mgnify:CR=1 FL=1
MDRRPSYQQVCSGLTGHTEGLQLSFDPAVVSYEALCDWRSSHTYEQVKLRFLADNRRD